MHSYAYARTASGSIDRDDLEHFGQVYSPAKASEVDVDRLIRLMDLRNIGKLNLADFVNLAIAKKKYNFICAKLDRDQADELDTEEEG